MSHHTSESEPEDHSSAPPEKIRRFGGCDAGEELLPIKIGGRLVRQFQVGDGGSGQDTSDESEVDDEESGEEDLSNLSAAQLLLKKRELQGEMKQRIANCVQLLTADPQENVIRLHELYRMASGTAKDVHPVLGSMARRWAAEALTGVFIDIAPGYQIRSLSEEERKQQMKLETRRAQHYETTLLEVYQKFVTLLDSNIKGLLTKRSARGDEEGGSVAATKLTQASVECLCRLLENLGHFNCVNAIISSLIGLCVSSTPQAVLDRIGAALSTTFKEDLRLTVSLHAVKTIAEFVNGKRGYVWPGLIAALMSLNVRESDLSQQVSREMKAKERRLPRRGQGPHVSRMKRKLVKKLEKKETPLRSIEAVQRLSERMKLATETMKHLFATYFRILKRMPTTALLPPVLEGLAKFAHLINVDFFEDLVATMGELVEQKHLKVSEILHCAKTVCVVLSGEGQALNIDPLKFYNTVYNALPSLPFQPSTDALTAQVGLVVDCLGMLLIKRRKLVSLVKVAAFVKRVLLVSLLLPTRHSIALLAMTRAIFVAHSGLCNQVGEDAEEDVVANGVYQPDGVNPDSSNSACTDFVSELKLLSMHPDRVLSSFANNLQQKIPSTGQWRLSAQYTGKDPREWLTYDGDAEDTESPFKPAVMQFCKKRKIASLTSKNVCSTLCKFLERRRTTTR